MPEHLYRHTEFSLEPRRLAVMADGTQRLDGRLRDITYAADLLAELSQFVEPVDRLGTAPGTQDLTAGTKILGVEFDAEIRFIVMVVAPPSAAGPAAIDRKSTRLNSSHLG